MDIHKPKPVHGWKEFLGEIAVIVVGVLIALTAEQVVEALHWRGQLKDARAALAKDMGEVVGMAADRESFSACLDQHLNHLSDVIEEASRTGRLPPLGAPQRASHRLWTLTSWDGLIAAGIAPHLPRDQLYTLSLVTFYLRVAQNADGDENAQWTRLYTMVGPGRPLEAGEAPELRAALSGARADAKSLRLAVAQITRMIKDTHMLSAAQEKQVKDYYLAGPVHTVCKPDGPVPTRYGDGPPAGEPLDRPLPQ